MMGCTRLEVWQLAHAQSRPWPSIVLPASLTHLIPHFRNKQLWQLHSTTA